MKIKIILYTVFITITLSSCVHHVRIDEHQFTIYDIRQSTIDKIEEQLEKSGYTVTLEHSEEKGTILGDEIKDQTFLISKEYFTEVDLRNITYAITHLESDDPIKLRESKLKQNFLSASGEGTATVKLTIELTGNAKAFYKRTDEPVKLYRQLNSQSATFAYQRKKGEEYVDIYIVPEYAEDSFRPQTFLRISLSHPYDAERMPWESWYKKLWETVAFWK